MMENTYPIGRFLTLMNNNTKYNFKIDSKAYNDNIIHLTD